MSWLLTGALLVYALTTHDQAESTDNSADGAPDSADDDARLRIDSIKPLEIAPGAAIVVRVEGLDEGDPLSVEIAKQNAEVLHRDAERLVVRVPRTAEHGPAKVRVYSGARRSKPWVITLRPLPRHEMIRNVLGGLALFVLGLRTVGQSLRAYAGRRVRAVLALLTRGRLRPASLGTLVGFLMQSTTSAAGLLAGLSSARMLKPRAAVALLLGAQLGAALAAVIVPLVATREALWVVSIGVVWILLAESRLTRALGMVVVGAGVVFHALGLLQAGLAPLVSDPHVLPYLSYLDSTQPLGLFYCVLAGAVLTALLQGPSPVFALVMSLAQSSGALDLRDGLAILTGVGLGAVIGTMVAAWPFGSDARRMAAAHLLLGSATTLLAALGLPLWLGIASASTHGASNSALLSWASSDALLPGMALQLSIGFLSFTLVNVVAGVLLVPLALRTAERLRKRTRAPKAPIAPAQLEHGAMLASALTQCALALEAVREIIRTADRAPSADAEQALRDAQTTLRSLLENPDQAVSAPLRAATIGCIQLGSAIESALRVAEKAPEHEFTLADERMRALERLHEIAERALSALSMHLRAQTTPSLVQAQAHEIELNALEADTRRKLFERSELPADELPALLWMSELCASYEVVGNQLYRIANVLGTDELD